MSKSTVRTVQAEVDNDFAEEPEETARSRTTSFSLLNLNGTNAPTSRLSTSQPWDFGNTSSYYDTNPTDGDRQTNRPETASSRPSYAVSSTTTQLNGSQTPSLYSPARYSDEESGLGIPKAYTPLHKTSGRHSAMDGRQTPERGTLSRSNSSANFGEKDGLVESAREINGNGFGGTVRKGSYASSVRYSDVGRGRPYSRNGALSALSDIEADSSPGTPLEPPTPIWIHQSRSSSPVASSLWLPDEHTGRPSLAASSIASQSYRSHQSLVRLFPDTPSTFWDREWIREGYIAKIHRRDDKDEWPNWKRYLYYSVPFLAILTLGTYWLYFILRILCVISAQRADGRSFPLAWIFIGVEISVAIPTFLQLFWSVFILKKRNRPKLRLVGNDVPTVDVFITCCGEDVDIVMDTARAACDLDYPQDRFRVVILDDGNSAELREAVMALNLNHPNLAYRSRPKFPGVPHHFKAGNLNYGLDAVHDMPGGASRYIAALDADMIPEQHWLRAIMPHMLEDDKMALACPPQLFYNVPPGDPLCQSLDFFVHVSEPIKDALGVAWCTGSGYIVRRDALEEIGCFPQGSLAEDVATSTLLLGRGWKCAYIHEPLQFGTVPDDFGSHLKQRTRWAVGTVDTSFKLKFCLWGKEIKQLTFYQRMSSFIYAVLSLYNIFLTLSLFALPVVLITGNALVAYANENQLRWLIRACFAALASNRICELAMFLPSGYATGQRGSRAQIWMAPYISLSIIRSFVLPTWLGGQKQAFKPTGSLKSELNERNPATRAGVWQRFVVITTSYMAGYHLFYVYLVLAAVTLTTMRCIFDKPTIEEKLVCMLTHAFWPPIAWIITLSAFWTPISYALNPPSVPDREQLLTRDPKTDIAHPTKKSKSIAFQTQTAIFEFEYFISTTFTTLLFIASFVVGIA